jgi:hypothetical protein
MIIRDAELRDARGIAEELFRRGARTLSQRIFFSVLTGEPLQYLIRSYFVFHL